MTLGSIIAENHNQTKNLRLFCTRYYTVSKKPEAELVDGPLATFGGRAVTSVEEGFLRTVLGRMPSEVLSWWGSVTQWGKAFGPQFQPFGLAIFGARFFGPNFGARILT